MALVPVPVVTSSPDSPPGLGRAVVVRGPARPPTPALVRVAGYSPDPPAYLTSPGSASYRAGPPLPQTVGPQRTYVSRGEDAPPFAGSAAQSRGAQPLRDIPPRPTVIRGDDARPSDGWVFKGVTPYRVTPQTVPPAVVVRQSPYPVFEGSAVALAGPKMYAPVPRAVVAAGEDARPAEGQAWVYRPRLKQEVRPGRVSVCAGDGPRAYEGWTAAMMSVALRGRVVPDPIDDPAPVFHALPRLRFRSPVRPV